MPKRRRLEYMRVDDLPPDPDNPKDHDDPLIARSIVNLGFIEPIVLDERTGQIISGHGRRDFIATEHEWPDGTPPPDGIALEAKTGRWLVPVVRGWSSRDDTQRKQALVVLNRAGERGGWRPRALETILSELNALPMPELGDNTTALTLTGFESHDLDAMIADLDDAAKNGDGGSSRSADDDVPDEPPERVNAGDVWRIGRHLLFCGDCRDVDAMNAFLDGVIVNLGVTSPPYAEQRNYDPSSGFVPIKPDEYVEWFAPVASNIAAHLADDGSWLVNIKPPAETLDMDLYVFDLVIAHVREWGWHFASEFCWERLGVPKSPKQRLKNGFEPVYQFVHDRWKFRPENVTHHSDAAITPDGIGGSPHEESVQGSGNNFFEDRDIGPGLAFPSNRLPTFAGSHDAVGHSAAFPVGLPEFFARLFCDAGDVVLDPFAGSGSSIIAAERSGRLGYGVELSPKYCDVIVERAVRLFPSLHVERVDRILATR